MLEGVAQLQRFAQLQQEAQSTEAGQAFALEENMERPRPVRHSPQAYQKDMVVESDIPRREKRCS